jgi:hypothetical protein
MAGSSVVPFTSLTTPARTMPPRSTIPKTMALFSLLRCKIARNVDPAAAGSQRIDLVVKDPNLAGSRVAPNRDPTQETNSPAQSVAYMYSQVGSPLEAISQADYRTGEECQR